MNKKIKVFGAALDASDFPLSIQMKRGYLNRLAQNFVDDLFTIYSWKVIIDDNNGHIIEKIFNFTTTLIELKWSVKLGEGHLRPLMGDIDNDGDQELITSASGRVRVINGKTGQKEWAYAETSSTAVELADLNNDGTPEILCSGKWGTPQVHALNGDGSVRWISPQLTGETHPQFPIISFDTDPALILPGHLTIAGTLQPPSQLVFFSPRKGVDAASGQVL